MKITCSTLLIFFALLSCDAPQQEVIILKVCNSAGAVERKSLTYYSFNEALNAAKTYHGKCIVEVDSGTYFLTTPILIDSLFNNISIVGNENSRPVIYGGKKLANLQQEEDYWVAEVDNTDIRLLEVNGRLAPRSRIPEKGRYQHLSEFHAKWLSTAEGGFSPKPTEEQLLKMKFKPQDLEKIDDLENTELTVFHMWDETLVTVASVDRITHEIKFNIPAAYPPGSFGYQDYIIWNSKYGMTQPGQWYIDKKAKKLYYWPLPGEDLKNTSLIVPELETILHVQNAGNITLKNLEFRSNKTPLMIGGFGAKWFQGAVMVENSKDIKLANLTFKNLSSTGLKVIKGNNINISGCNFSYLGASGIRFIGSNSLIYNNLMHDVGILYPSAIGLYVNVTDPNAVNEWELGKGEGNVLIDSNSIYNTPYVGIACGGSNTKITNNSVHDVMQELGDGSGIYMTFCKDLLLRGNIIYNIRNKIGHGGTSAYYLDEMTSNATIESNIAINVNRPLHNHFCSNNTFTNNIFIVEEGDLTVDFPRCENMTLQKNILLTKGDIKIEGINTITHASNNIMYSTAGGKYYVSDMKVKERVNWREIQEDHGFIIKDPKIEVGKDGKVEFLDHSIANEVGIKPIQ